MKLKSIKTINKLDGLRVLLREDYNVPIGNDGNVSSKEDWRIVRSLLTIKYLTQKRAKIIILSHLGRPGGKEARELSLQPVAKRLSQLLKKKVYFISTWNHEEILKTINNLKSGEILLLENVRFNRQEEFGGMQFAKKLAAYGDIYVNDAFANSHRTHASMLTITQFLPSYAGFLLEEEILRIKRVLDRPRRPFIGIVGGVKISSKLNITEHLLTRVDYLLLAGGLANTIFKARGLSIGESVFEPKMLDVARRFKNHRIILPVDLVVCSNGEKLKCRCVKEGCVKENEKIFDIGPKTINLFGQILLSTKTVFWNGPLGLTEKKEFRNGTFGLLASLKRSEAEIIIGGGETVEVLLDYDRKMIKKENIFVSTGGGSLLKLIETGSLPALKPLLIKEY